MNGSSVAFGHFLPNGRIILKVPSMNRVEKVRVLAPTWSKRYSTCSSVISDALGISFARFTPGKDSRMERPLVTTQAATSRLRTELGGIAYADGVYTVTGLCVKRGSTVISSLETLTINTVNP